MARRWLAPETAADLGRLDPEAIARVREEAWPDATNVDELHDALVWLGFLTEEEAETRTGWTAWLAELGRAHRAARIVAPGATLWIAAERVPQFSAFWPGARLEPAIAAPPGHAGQDGPADAALIEILRGRLEGLGPVTVEALAAPLGIENVPVCTALAALEAEGFAMRGHFTPMAIAEEWCDRRLLARIHHYTVKRLRAEIEPVSARDFLRFLLAWQRLTPNTRMEGPDALKTIVEQLEGFEAPAGAWETEILPARLENYDPVLARRSLLGRAHRLGEVAANQRTAEWQRAQFGAGASPHDADYFAQPPSRAALGVPFTGGRERRAERPGASHCRLHTGAWRILL